MAKKYIIVHTCCAPCMTAVHERLEDSFGMLSFYYNPNIAPADEYKRRMDELIKFSKLKGFELEAGEYDSDDFLNAIDQLKHLGERSERCWRCYEYRLEETARIAVKKGIETITTTLSVSPHKNAEMINRIGSQLAEKYAVQFLTTDFKKKNGYRRSVELSAAYGFYRQQYCGCVYSRIEKEQRAAH